MPTAHICRSLREQAGGPFDGAEPSIAARCTVLIVRPDHARTIDLPGAGPCPRPIDVDRSHTGFTDLVSLRVYSFSEGKVIDGEAEGDEVFIVLMRGAVGINVSQTDGQSSSFALGSDGGSRVVFMPPHAAYRLTAAADSDIAYARAEPVGTTLPATRAFALNGDRLDIAGYATGMELSLTTGATDTLATLDQLRERFVHFRSSGGARATIAGEAMNDWDTAALDAGEMLTLDVAHGAADILTISASRSRMTAATGAIHKAA